MTPKIILPVVTLVAVLACATTPPPAPIEAPPAGEAAPNPPAAPTPGEPVVMPEPPAPPEPAAEPAAPSAPAEPAEPVADAKPAKTSKATKVATSAPAKKKPTAPTAAAAPAATATPAAPAAPAAPRYSGDSPCKTNPDPNGVIGKACARAGVQGAKGAMKDLVRKGRAAGQSFECDDCHKDDTDYSKLSDNAKSKLERLLSVVK